MAHDHGHDHTAGAGGEEPDPKATPMFVTGVVGILITIITCLFVTILYRHQARIEREVQVLNQADPNPEMRRHKELQQAELRGTPRVLGVAKPGEVAPLSTTRKGIPIDRAMALVAAEKQGR